MPCTVNLWKGSRLAKGVNLKRVTRIEAQDIIDETRGRQEHVDRRLDYAVRQSLEIFSLQLRTSESYLSLFWPRMSGAEWLTPKGSSKTLKDVAGRLIEGGYDFEQLANGADGLPDSYDPAFFAKFPFLDENFDYGRFGLLGLATLIDEEQTYSPAAIFLSMTASEERSSSPNVC